MECRTRLLFCIIAVRTTALAPSFDTFSAAATGSWHGTQYEWPGDANGVACETVVDEVMRSCGGAVQGIRVGDGPLLNRQDDGFCFFDCGSWTQGPTALADVAAFDVGLATHSGRVRCVVSVDVAARKAVEATVVVEEKAGAAPLAKRESLAATGAPWLAPRLKWKRTTEEISLPVDAVALHGGVSIACVDNNGATDVVVHADDVSLTRSYDASGALVAISLQAP
jgi:hypothetical protein